jgi:hypothetical protein
LRRTIDNHQHRSIPKPSHQRSIELTTIDQTHANRSIIPTGYKDVPQWRLPPVGSANDRTSNTKIIEFLQVGNRSIISTGYKDAPQYRSIEPQTLELLGFVRFNSSYGEKISLDTI